MLTTAWNTVVAKRVNELEGGRKTKTKVRLATEADHDEYDDDVSVTVKK